jgi:hypothetical protein
MLLLCIWPHCDEEHTEDNQAESKQIARRLPAAHCIERFKVGRACQTDLCDIERGFDRNKNLSQHHNQLR